MTAGTALRWPVGPAAAAVELTAGIDIRQNRYQGWHPVAGAWDPRSVPFNVHDTGQVRPNGTAFGMQPALGAFPGQGPVTGFQGRRLVNSKNRNLGTLIGELQSEVFTIAGAGIDFLIGGGDFADVTCLNLYVNGAAGWERVRSATGERNLELVRRGWDVAEFRGRQAYLQILDYAPWNRGGGTPRPAIRRMTGASSWSTTSARPTAPRARGASTKRETARATSTSRRCCRNGSP